MSHFLTIDEAGHWRVRRPPSRAAVRVRVEPHKRREPRKLVVESGVFVLKANDVALVPLPEDVVVMSKGGEVLKPTWGFWVSVETFDPYHVLTDWEG
jgi:hypothetical protein